MSLLSLLQHLAAADTMPQPTERRTALAQLARTAAVALPAVLAGAVVTPATAQRSGTLLDALLLILRVEWLQEAFYSRLLTAPTVVPAAIQPDLALIRAQQQQHVALLENVISTSGGVLPTRPTYDFTGSHGQTTPSLFPDVFTSADTALAVAQVLEDFSVRAYQGQLASLMSNNDLMDLVVRMYAVEGRHAAHLRRLRQQRGASVKPWISGTDGDGPIPPATAPIYAGEGQLEQLATVSVYPPVKTSLVALLPTLPVLTDAEQKAAATEAYDEPLTTAEAQRIMALFVI
ncbi:ferritin-like domain-containing protein [Hymenobacter sp. CRA2]|uniref:ferritin-like domain-containing protein n=1 Tax=Hymenobacter sp. CRA2 TaxID=1955620 RepID=UPI00098FED73|nr:ferritin-like domain-containing protein [Hymenobacter sp. CRA2]OON67932.1 hypothetical protein B0919_14770 [Hymenobacter sp. CRA2]